MRSLYRGAGSKEDALAWAEQPVLRAGDVAVTYGATDVLVLRKVTEDKWAHLGGAGLGEDWIGIIELGPDSDEPVLRQALGSRKVVRHRADKPVRVIGPYYAQQWAVLRVDGDYMIVLGRADDEVPLAAVRDAELRVKCATLVSTMPVVSPAKRLADEMAVLSAMQDMYKVPQVSFEQALQLVIEIVTEALSCELGLIITGTGRSAVQYPDAPEDWDAEAAKAAIEALLPLAPTQQICVQDAARDPLPAPLDPASGVCSYYIVPLPEPIGGAFAVFHTDGRPAGSPPCASSSAASWRWRPRASCTPPSSARRCRPRWRPLSSRRSSIRSPASATGAAGRRRSTRRSDGSSAAGRLR